MPGQPRHRRTTRTRASVMLFDVEHGEPLAILDASAITAIRTAAVSGVATARWRARTPATSRSSARASQARDPPRGDARGAAAAPRAGVEPRPRERASASPSARRARTGFAIEAVASAADAVRRRRPRLHRRPRRASRCSQGAWLAPGAHVNAVGACFADARELDTEAVRARALLRRPPRVVRSTRPATS